MSMKNYWLLLLVLVVGMASCKKRNDRSDVTGWKYNDQEWGGFSKADYEDQETGPNLVLITGGTFLMGLTDEDVTYEWNNVPRRVTVTSFYMDETEVSNINYREYLYDMNRLYGGSGSEPFKKALPDTLVWRENLAFNEPLVENYFRYPGYDDYPVVGVNWFQANDFCKWRTNKVNEMLLIEKGIFNPNAEQSGQDVFDTKAYLSDMYEGSVNKQYKAPDGTERKVRYEDGVLLPEYRLPTEAEWEYAAIANQGNAAANGDELIENRNIFPWKGGYTARYKKVGKYQGRMMANFKRGAGDYMGVSANLNDNAAIPSEIRENLPNDFGLYNMSGNVNEWVLDVYRPTTSETIRDVDNEDMNPFRGNVFMELVKDEDNRPIKDSLGRLQERVIADSTGRRNYTKGDARNYLDGHSEEVVYEYGVSSLINEDSRVIKGGSWGDRLYWLAPGTRRFADANTGSKTIGFRCAMIRIGGASPNGGPGEGNKFKAPKKKKRKYK